MSKHRKQHHRSYTEPTSRQQMREKQFDRELRNAQQGVIDESSEEIARELDEELAHPTKDEPQASSDGIPLAEKEPEEKKKWQQAFVVDTNLLLSCPDVIYDGDDEKWRKPKKFRPKLDNAHIIVPYVVFEELNHIKSEKTHRGMIARKVFRRLVKFFPNTGRSLNEIMNLEKPIKTGYKTQTISLLPLHRNFSKILPWVPDRDDNDGWIAVTALAATMIADGLPVDGTKDDSFDIMKRDNSKDLVTLLTNDRSLLSKADDFAVHVQSYSFEKPPVFTGCRELIVPPEMFRKIYYCRNSNDEGVSAEEFAHYFPNEPELVANEYIIMHVEDEADLPRGYFADTSKFKNIARFIKKNGMLYPLRFMKYEGTDPANAGIATYYDAMNDDSIKVVNVTGKAGTGKTYQAIVHAIKEVQAGRYIQVVLIPSKSAKNPLGALPGNKEQKMEPLVKTAKGAIRSYLASTDEFVAKRKLLQRFGDTDDEMLEGDNEEEENKNSGNNRSDRDARRTHGNYPGNFDDLDEVYGLSRVSSEDFRDDGHSKKNQKKNKAHYPGKSDKGKDGGPKPKKLTYREALEKETENIYSRYFVCVPYEEAQGDSFEDSIIIVDEAQRLKVDDADTILSRPAKGSKMFVMGDISQIHDSSPEKALNNALCYSRLLFGDWEGCANINLTTNMRSDIADIMTRNRDRVRHMMGLD